MIIYVDDFFIMYRNIDEHLNFLSKLFDKFRKYNLCLHPKKVTNATTTGIFLGFTQQAGGYTVDKSHCKIVKEYRQPNKWLCYRRGTARRACQ